MRERVARRRTREYVRRAYLLGGLFELVVARLLGVIVRKIDVLEGLPALRALDRLQG